MYDVGPPTVYCINNHTVSVEGDNVSLICIAINDINAIHSLQVNWFKGNQLIPNGTDVIHNKIDKTSRQLTSTLIFDPVNPSDHGIYTFRAFNQPESYSESKIEFIVECTVELCAYIYVTGFRKINPNRTFGISRIINLKYFTHCESLVLGCSHAIFTI